MSAADTQPNRSRRELLALTGLPTAAGREDRVIEWIERWVADRPDVALERDPAGNLMLSFCVWHGVASASACSSAEKSAEEHATPPLILAAHLDHPAFVVDRVVAPSVISAAFRGGVLEPYFHDGAVIVHPRAGDPVRGRIVETTPPNEPQRPFRECVIELEGSAENIQLGDIAVWDLPAPRIVDGSLEAPACDDLAAVAAALEALDALRERACGAEQNPPDVRVLLTRAEEVGFVGAIAACKHGTIPPGARVLALENSRAFADSPIGAGPIVRVGDRVSTFSPTLTEGAARVARALAGQSEREPAKALSVEPIPGFRWQRKLMPGGACEASAYAAYGYDATCLCLSLGAYHNMGDLDDVQPAVHRGEWSGPAPIKPERISVEDYDNLVHLLTACGEALGEAEPLIERLDRLYEQRRFVLGCGGKREGEKT